MKRNALLKNLKNIVIVLNSGCHGSANKKKEISNLSRLKKYILNLLL